MDKRVLEELSASIWEKLRKAVADGETAQAIALVDDLKKATDMMKATLLDVIDFSLTALAIEAGEEAVEELMRKHSLLRVWPNFGGAWMRLSPEERLRRRAQMWTVTHGVNVEITEDDDKFVFKVPCSTGGTLHAKDDTGKTEFPHTWTYGEAAMVHYCVHCPVAFEIMPIEQEGYPWWITFPPKKPGDRCVQYHYKDITKTPEEYYRRVGMRKSTGEDG